MGEGRRQPNAWHENNVKKVEEIKAKEKLKESYLRLASAIQEAIDFVKKPEVRATYGGLIAEINAKNGPVEIIHQGIRTVNQLSDLGAEKINYKLKEFNPQIDDAFIRFAVKDASLFPPQINLDPSQFKKLNVGEELGKLTRVQLIIEKYLTYLKR